MDTSATTFNRLLLDLSLVSALPIGLEGRDILKATSSANALVCRTSTMQARELRELVYTVLPLLTLMMADINSPLSLKAGHGLASLMPSRICMTTFLECGGLNHVSKLLDIFLGRNMIDLHDMTLQQKILTDHLFTIYREVSRFYPHLLVPTGAIRHCVLVLRFGDVKLQTIAASVLGMLAGDLAICKIMFSYGALKPLLIISDGVTTNEACVLTGLGTIIQLCRIPLIGTKVVKMGGLPVLEKALNKNSGLSVSSIREKALLALAWLGRVPELRPSLCSGPILAGMRRELSSGTLPSRYTVVQMILTMFSSIPNYEEFLLGVRHDILELLFVGPWHAKNLVLKAVVILFRSEESRMWLAENGIFDALFALIQSKSKDLQEVPLVMLLSLFTHPKIPLIFLEKGGAQVLGQLLYAKDEVINDLAVVLMKTLFLYDRRAVEEGTPSDRAHLMHVQPEPGLYGNEYGGLVETYLQRIVENRRDQSYLLEGIPEDELASLALSGEELENYMNTFMELDFDLAGKVGEDEFKVLLIMMGETPDKEELAELFEKSDLNHDGMIDFREFIIMMKNWKTRFGTGSATDQLVNKITQSGTVGKARKAFSNWYNKEAIEKAQIEAVKAKKKAEEEERKALAAQHWQAEQIALQREQAVKLRRAQQALEG